MIDTILFKIGWKKMHFRMIKIDKIAIYFVVSFYTNFYTRDVSWDICGIFDRVKKNKKNKKRVCTRSRCKSILSIEILGWFNNVGEKKRKNEQIPFELFVHCSDKNSRG